MFSKDSKNSTQIEAEITSHTLNTTTNENNLQSTSKQLSVKPNKELETKAIKTSSPTKFLLPNFEKRF